jgi:hypothetical protein
MEKVLFNMYNLVKHGETNSQLLGHVFSFNVLCLSSRFATITSSFLALTGHVLPKTLDLCHESKASAWRYPEITWFHLGEGILYIPSGYLT